MAFTPDNYLRARQALREIQEVSNRHMTQIDNAIAQIERAYSALQAMPTDWSGAVTYIQDRAAAPGATALEVETNEELQQTIADFQSMRDIAGAVETAAKNARG